MKENSRSQLVQEFKDHGRAVLLGTDTYWTGIDIQGPALTQVIIPRLPFANPSHPVVQARTEWYQEKGRSAFAEMTLPEALIKFRQGIGRLISIAEGIQFINNLPHS